MKKNPLNQGVLTENFLGIGSVTGEMIYARASELALIAGRVPPHVAEGDYEQARRELVGDSERGGRETTIESIPESERWNPVPDSTGHQTPESPSEDEDSEGRSETEQLVEEGVEAAQHDQMLQAARSTEKKRSDQPQVSTYIPV